MAILTKGRTSIKTYAGLQVRQYRDQLHKAGMLNAVLRATGAERSRLNLAASCLIRHLRRGEVSGATRIYARELGLEITPNPGEPIPDE